MSLAFQVRDGDLTATSNGSGTYSTAPVFDAFGASVSGARVEYDFGGAWLYRNVSNTGGLTHIGARWYDPANLVDPSGEMPILAVVAIGAAAGALVGLIKESFDDLPGVRGDRVIRTAVIGAVLVPATFYCGGRAAIGKSSRTREGVALFLGNVVDELGEWLLGGGYDWVISRDMGGNGAPMPEIEQTKNGTVHFRNGNTIWH